MIASSKVPQIRFKGFSGEWVSEKFGKCVLIQRGGSPRPIENFITDDKDGINWIKIGDVSTNSRYITKTKQKIIQEGEKHSRKVYKGDLILSNSMSFGRPYIMEIEGCIHDGWLLIRDEKNIFNLEYLLQLLSSDYMLNQYKALASGGVVINLNSELVQSTNIFIPDINEQTKIGNYFQNLDRLIEQKQKKEQKLMQLKKAMLEKIFPKDGQTTPEIRFKGFSGEWEETIFNKTFVNIPNNTLSRDELNYNYGLAKNIHYGDVLIKFGELLDMQKEKVPFISNNDYVNKLKSAKLQNGDIVIADAAEDEIVGKCTEIINIKKDTVLSGLHTIPVRPIKSFASKYLGFYMNSPAYHNQLLPLLQGTKVLSISKSAIKNTEIHYPSNSLEQTKIGDYFQKLDHLIELHQQELKKLKNIKKALLDKMFV